MISHDTYSPTMNFLQKRMEYSTYCLSYILLLSHLRMFKNKHKLNILSKASVFLIYPHCLSPIKDTYNLLTINFTTRWTFSLNTGAMCSLLFLSQNILGLTLKKTGLHSQRWGGGGSGFHPLESAQLRSEDYVIWHKRKPCRDEQTCKISRLNIKAVFKLWKFMLILCIFWYCGFHLPPPPPPPRFFKGYEKLWIDICGKTTGESGTTFQF